MSSWWYGTNAIDPYIEFSEAFVTDPHSHVVGDDLSSLVINTATMYEEKMRHVGAIFLSLWARYRLGKMFEGRPKTKDGENTEDLLISLCMDLKGNPTSEMGHAMVRMAGMPEIKDTETPEEFCKGLSEEGGSFSNEFRALYTDFMNRYGCRGMMEIDIASPRTSERPEEFFHKLRQIDTADNAIQKVTERRKDAHEKLLEIAKELGRESDFLYYDTAVHSFLGYREHPKYMSECICWNSIVSASDLFCLQQSLTLCLFLLNSWHTSRGTKRNTAFFSPIDSCFHERLVPQAGSCNW